ncbi:MAG: peptidylprolyl isomerase, partial [Sphingopyxis sp.]
MGLDKMNRRKMGRMLAVAATLLVIAAPAQAQTVAALVTPEPAPAPEVTAPAPVAAVQHVMLTTPHGTIIIAVEIERAPISAANFLAYVDARRLDGVTFYRAMDLGRGYGLIQGGTQGNPRITYPAIAHEPTSRTGLSHTDGAISFARLAPGTATSDFFITVGALTSLDAQAPGSGGDVDGFAVFGHVVRGMDVVRSIMAAPTDPNAGAGVMRGQMIAAPVRITTARRSAAP